MKSELAQEIIDILGENCTKLATQNTLSRSKTDSHTRNAVTPMMKQHCELHTLLKKSSEQCTTKCTT